MGMSSFRFQPGARLSKAPDCSVPASGGGVTVGSGRVGGAEVNPTGAVVLEDAVNLLEGPHEVRHKALRGGLAAQLALPCPARALRSASGLEVRVWVRTVERRVRSGVVSRPRSARCRRRPLMGVVRVSPPHLGLGQISAHAPVRRRSHDALDRVVGQLAQAVDHVALQDQRREARGEVGHAGAPVRLGVSAQSPPQTIASSVVCPSRRENPPRDRELPQRFVGKGCCAGSSDRSRRRILAATSG